MPNKRINRTESTVKQIYRESFNYQLLLLEIRIMEGTVIGLTRPACKTNGISVNEKHVMKRAAAKMAVHIIIPKASSHRTNFHYVLENVTKRALCSNGVERSSKRLRSV